MTRCRKCGSYDAPVESYEFEQSGVAPAAHRFCPTRYSTSPVLRRCSICHAAWLSAPPRPTRAI